MSDIDSDPFLKVFAEAANGSPVFQAPSIDDLEFQTSGQTEVVEGAPEDEPETGEPRWPEDFLDTGERAALGTESDEDLGNGSAAEPLKGELLDTRTRSKVSDRNDDTGPIEDYEPPSRRHKAPRGCGRRIVGAALFTTALTVLGGVGVEVAVNLHNTPQSEAPAQDPNSAAPTTGWETAPKPTETQPQRRNYHLTPEADSLKTSILSEIGVNKAIYEQLEKETGVPKEVFAALHAVQNQSNPKKGMINGDGDIGTQNYFTGIVNGHDLHENGQYAATQLVANAAFYKLPLSRSMSPDKIYAAIVSFSDEQLADMFQAMIDGDTYLRTAAHGHELKTKDDPAVWNGVVEFKNQPGKDEMVFSTFGHFDISCRAGCPDKNWGVVPDQLKGVVAKRPGAMAILKMQLPG